MSQFDNQGNQDLSGKIAAHNKNQLGSESHIHGPDNTLINHHDASIIDSNRQAQSIADKAKEGNHTQVEIKKDEEVAKK
jgi:hypothetical protein